MGPGILPEITVGKHNLPCHLQMPTKALSCIKQAIREHGLEVPLCPVGQGSFKMGCFKVGKCSMVRRVQISMVKVLWSDESTDNMMAPHMAASVCCSLVLFLFLFVCPVLSNDFPISFTRNELLDIRNSTPDNLLPTFEHSDVLLDILVGGAAFLFKRSRRRKRGKRAGALVKTRQRSLRTPLPSIHLANLRSLANKSDELQLLTRTNKDFLNSAVLCFTETWLNGAIPDSALHLSGFQLFRADRVTESSGKREVVDYVFISMKAGVQT